MAQRLEEIGAEEEARSPLAPICSNEGLHLSNWNQSLLSNTCTPSKTPWKLTGKPQRTPVPSASQRVKTPAWATRRVVAGSTPSRRPVQLSTRLLDTPTRAVPTASCLSNLPNATQAEFWLRKAHNLQVSGDVQGAQQILKQALKRDVRPATEITRALAKLEGDDRPEGAATGREDKLSDGAAAPSKPQLQTPAPGKSHVHFETPEANVIPQLSTEQNRGDNIQSAGCTPFRASSLKGELGDDFSCTSGSSFDTDKDTPETQMKRVVLPILERTMGDLRLTTPAAAPATAGDIPRPIADERFDFHLLKDMGRTSTAPEEARIDGTDASGPLHEADNEEQLRKGEALSLEISTERPALEEYVDENREDGSFTEKAQSAEDAVNLRNNELFDATPSPGAPVREEYTPKLTPAITTPALRRPTSGTTLDLSGEGGFESPEILGFQERGVGFNQAEPMLPNVANLRRQATTQPSPLGRLAAVKESETNDNQAKGYERALPSTPQSAVRDPLQAEPRSLSKPLRFASGRPRVGKHEMRNLLEDNQATEGLGSIAALSPMKTPSRLRGTLGTREAVITPVRRSARKSTAFQAPSSLLRSVGYNFVPNVALEARLGSKAVVGPAESFRDFAEDGAEVEEDFALLSLNDRTPLLTQNEDGQQLGEHEGSLAEPETDVSQTLAVNHCDIQTPAHKRDRISKAVSSVSQRITRSAAKQKISMSPTEEGIRADLHRKAKAQTKGSGN